MILRIETLQEACKNILTAVDSNELSAITETLELVTKDGNLYMNVTNREYFVQVEIPVGDDVELHATVNANLFLRLISHTTTDTVELNVVDSNLIVKANGTYKIPLIFDGDELLELPQIEINNVTNEFSISTDVLKSILNYNSKELVKGTISKSVQKLYYVDDKGCITFTNGACVNSFTLEQPIKLLFNNRLVKLFKLFTEPNVNFTVGFDPISEDIIQTKVKFKSKGISLTAILSCDDKLLAGVPVTAIRGRASGEYPYSININKEAMLQTISRLLLFNSTAGTSAAVIKPYSTFEFGKDSVTIYDIKKENKEVISYKYSLINCEEPYTAILDLSELKVTLESCSEPYLNINFGDSQALVITRGNISNIIPECHLN
jgi:hypothetical protein